MNYAVKFYKDVKDEFGRPAEWPHEVKPIESEADCPVGWTIMSPEEYEAHRALHQAKYDAWHQGHLKRQARRLALKKAARALRSAQLRWYILLFLFSETVGLLLGWWLFHGGKW